MHTVKNNPCTSPAFSDGTVAGAVAESTFDKYVSARGRLLEQKLAKEMEKDKQSQVHAELQRLRALDEEQRQVEQARLHIQEQILNLACPRCSAVFVDFDDCFALSCNRCLPQCGFCAWCLQDCGADAHRHVARCPYNLAPGKNVYGTKELFAEAVRVRRVRLVTEYLHSLPDAVKRNVIRRCERDFSELGLHFT